MFGKLLALFIIVPLIELFILIKVGEFIGAWQTVALVVLTGFVGAYLARLEGWRTWLLLQTELRQLKMPTDRLFEGVLILVGGILLLTPGILTDIFGLLLIIPVSRRLILKYVKQRFAKSKKFKDNMVVIDHKN